MDLNELNSEFRKLPKDEMMMLMRFRLLSAEKKIQFIMYADSELENMFGEAGRKIFDDIFNES